MEDRVSQITVERALRMLSEENLVRTRRGSGIYVAWHEEDDYYIPFHRPAGKGKCITLVHSLLGGTPVSDAILYGFAQRFMDVNPDIRIRFVKLNPNEGEDPYLQRFSNGELPTCGEFFWHSRYAKMNMLYPLDMLFGFEEISRKLLPQAVYSTPDLNGEQHIHALYFYLEIPRFLILNMRHFSSPGAALPNRSLSWPEVIRIKRAFDRTCLSRPSFSIALPHPNLFHNVLPYVELMGQDLLQEGYSPYSPEAFAHIFNSQSALTVLKTLKELMADGNVLSCNTQERFALGDVGLHPFASQWLLYLLDTFNSDMPYFISPYPPVGNNKVYRPFHSGFHVGIFRGSIKSEVQLEAAWRWLRFFFYPKSQELLSLQMKFPAVAKVEPLWKVHNPLLYSQAKIALKKSVPQPDFAGMRPAFIAIGKEITAFLQGHSNEETCLREIRNSLKRLFPDA